MLPPDVIFLKIKCTEFNFGWGLIQTPLEELTGALPDPLAGIKGHTSTGGKGEGRGATLHQKRGGDRGREHMASAWSVSL